MNWEEENRQYHERVDRVYGWALGKVGRAYAFAEKYERLDGNEASLKDAALRWQIGLHQEQLDRLKEERDVLNRRINSQAECIEELVEELNQLSAQENDKV